MTVFSRSKPTSKETKIAEFIGDIRNYTGSTLAANFVHAQWKLAWNGPNDVI
jgi:hypothetical protein